MGRRAGERAVYGGAHGEALRTALDGADHSWGDDAANFAVAVDAMRRILPCVNQAVDPATGAHVHRVEGLAGSDGFESGAAGLTGVVLRSFVEGAQFGYSLAARSGLSGWQGEDLAVGAPGWWDADGSPGAAFVSPGEGLESDTADAGASWWITLDP